MRKVPDSERRARLARRHAFAEPADDVPAAVESVVCLHATEPASVYLAAWARTASNREAIDVALYDDRSVVKQLAMRRTVFAFPRRLLPAVWGSASARVAKQQRERLARDVAKGGISTNGERWVEVHTTEVLELLRERGPMTTMELRGAIPALDSRLDVAPGTKWGREIPIAPRVLTTLAASGAIVRGTNDGGWNTSRPRWTATEHWLTEAPEPLAAREGYAELVRCWLRSFGPGNETDLVWWLGATKTVVRRALLDVDAVQVDLRDGIGFLLPDDVDPVDPPAPTAALLPILDPTTMGWKHRDFYLGEHRDRLFDSNGNAGATAWWDGRVVGGWSQEPDGTVVVLPLESLEAAAVGGLEAKAEELTAWLDGQVVNSVYHSPLTREHRQGWVATSSKVQPVREQ